MAKGRLFFVAECGENSILICRRGAGALRRLPLPPGACGPRRLLLSGRELFHADVFSSTVGQLILGSPAGQQLLPTGRAPADLAVFAGNLFTACGDSNSLWQFSAQPFFPMAALPAGACPVALCAGGGLLCAAECLCGRLGFYNAALRPAGFCAVEGLPLCADVSQEGFFAGVLLGSGKGAVYRTLGPGSLTEGFLTPAPVTGVRTFIAGGRAAGVALHLWENCATLFDAAELRPLRTFACGRMPDDVRTDGEALYISCLQDDAVEIYDLAGNLQERVATGREPRGLALCEGDLDWLE